MNREQFDEYEKDYIEILATKDEKLNVAKEYEILGVQRVKEEVKVL